MGAGGSRTAGSKDDEAEAVTAEADRRLVAASWKEAEGKMPAGYDGFVHSHRSLLLQHANDTVRRLFAYAPRDAQKRMMDKVLEWLVEPPDEDVLMRTAASHAHLGVTSEFLVLYVEPLPGLIAETMSTVTGKPVEDPEVQATQGAWKRGLDRLVRRFGVQCDIQRDALNLGADGTGEDQQKRLHAYETLRGSLERAERARWGTASPRSTFSGASSDPKEGTGILNTLTETGHAGMVRMSQYGRARRRPPRTPEEHNVEKYFRPRWMELHGQYMYYFQAPGGKPLGLIDLAKCQLVDTEMAKSPLPSPGQFSFALRTQTQQFPYYFIADGDNAKEQWFAKLKAACNRFSVMRSDLQEGERVRVWLADKNEFAWGVCRWVGSIAVIHHAFPPKPPDAPAYKPRTQDEQDAYGLWVGVELDSPLGKHNGTVHGTKYFECKDNHGILCPAHMAAPSSDLDPGQQEAADGECKYTPEHFDFITVLGKGSFGRVCKVREKATGRIFACKVLQKAALSKDSQMRNIRREKAILLQIAHPYIVKLHAVFQTGGRLFLLFDFLSGGELFYHMTRPADGTAFEEPRARLYIAEVALAVAHLHSHNIIHRDLKAENLVLDAEGHVVLTDFGFAKTVEPDMVNTTRCGTLPYMAPEILKPVTDAGYGFEVDWWSLGVLLFLMLTGCYPFWHRSHRKLMEQILYREIRPELFPPEPRLSLAAQLLTSAMLEKNPAARLANIKDFQEHEWFKGSGFNWAACLKRQIKPPFVPEPAGSNTKYFDVEPSQDASAMQSHALPEGYAYQKQFASFHDVHLDYKRLRASVEPRQGGSREEEEDGRRTPAGPLGNEQLDDREFIHALNCWGQNGSAADDGRITSDDGSFAVDT